MGYVYRYIDKKDGIIKYVGIVWSDERELRQRILEHKGDPWYQGKKWKIEYLNEDVQSRTDAEYLEAHFVSLFQTDKYYNSKKVGWGISKFIPKKNNWKEYSEKDIESSNKANKKKQVFSFRADIESIKVWKSYAAATEQTMESFGSAAMAEYMQNHKLNDKQKTKFDAYML